MPSAAQTEANLQLADEIGQFYADPLGFMHFAFEWGVGELLGFDGPDVWQTRFLTELGDQVRARGFDGVTPVEPIRMARASGHGIGKSALSAMLAWWILSTRPHSKGVITANTGDQLRTKTMAELEKWRRRCITGHWFETTTMSVSHVDHGETWRVDAQTCREENSEAFAGLHAADSTPWYLFDEASTIPRSIWEVALGGLTDGEPMHFAFGNPTRNSGTFREIFHGRLRHRWQTEHIDSRDAKMTNKTYLQQLIDDNGEDSDVVRVRVRGVFPRASDAQLIPSDDVSEAMKRGPGRYLGDDPLIGGLDVARGGADNCRLRFRRGRDCQSEKGYILTGEKSRDSMRAAAIFAEVLDRHKPDVTFVDETGIGGPILDRLQQLGYNVVGVNFGGRADAPDRYADKAAEMWARMRDWIMSGGALPDDPNLEQELTTREYWHDRRDRLVLEPKETMKKRGIASPDDADAIALTFAAVVPPRAQPRGPLDAHTSMRHNRAQRYNPLDVLDREDY